MIRLRMDELGNRLAERFDKLRAFMRAGIFVQVACWTYISYPIRRVFVSRDKQHRLKRHLMAKISQRILRILGVTILDSPRAPSAGKAQLIISNHTTALDVAVLGAVFASVALSRHDLERWPVLGQLAKWGDTIFVDRDNQLSGMSAIRQVRRLLEDNRSVMLFPEGKTSVGDHVSPFMPGAFAAARGLEVEIIPVGLAYEPALAYVDMSFGQHLLSIARCRRTLVAVEIGEPLVLKGSRDADTGHARAIVQELVLSARERIVGQS